MAQRRYDIAIFDLDGTLADTLPLIYESFDVALRQVLGHGFTPAEVREMFGPPDHLIIRSRVDPDNSDAAIARYNEHYKRRHRDLVHAFPGIPELLATCNALGTRLAVVTGKSRLTAIISLRELELLEYFTVLYGGDDVERQKPAPDALNHALDDLNFQDGERAVMIGDSAADIVAGKQAGINTIGVTWGSPDHAELYEAGPDAVVNSVSELEALLVVR